MPVIGFEWKNRTAFTMIICIFILYSGCVYPGDNIQTEWQIPACQRVAQFLVMKSVSDLKSSYMRKENLIVAKEKIDTIVSPWSDDEWGGIYRVYNIELSEVDDYTTNIDVYPVRYTKGRRPHINAMKGNFSDTLDTKMSDWRAVDGIIEDVRYEHKRMSKYIHKCYIPKQWCKYYAYLECE